MLLSEKLVKTINQQVGNEFGASMQYIQIAAYFDGQNLANLAQIFFDQAEEEKTHAMKFVHYLLEAGAEVAIPAIPQSQHTFESAVEAVGAALAWEQEVTKQVYNLVEIALGDKDYISQRFLDWFVSEQLEEIAKMDYILGVIKNAGKQNLFLVDNYIPTTLPQEPSPGEAA